MLVSVIIPLYNKEQCILDTLQSVLNQTYKDIEVVVIDDGSTDKSASVVLSIMDSRIKYYKKENGGVSGARNDGIDLATGDWVMFLDADDSLYLGAIEELVKLQYQNPNMDICCGNYKMVYANGTSKEINGFIDTSDIDNPFKLQWQGKWNMRLGSFIVRRKLVQKNKFMDGISMGEDVLFVNKLLENRVVYTKEIVMSYNKGFSSLSIKKLPIQKCYSWNNPVVHNNFYKTLSNGFDLGKSLMIHLSTGQYENFVFLLVKKGIYFPIIIYALLAKIFMRFK